MDPDTKGGVMRYLDGILPPRTIKSGVTVRAGLAYFALGNYVAVIKPSHNKDLLFVGWTLEPRK